MMDVNGFGYVYVLASETLSGWGLATISRRAKYPLGGYLYKIGRAEDVVARLAQLNREVYAGCSDWRLAVEPVQLSFHGEVETYVHRWVEKQIELDGCERWEWIDPQIYGLTSRDGSPSTEIFKAPLPAVTNYLLRAARTAFRVD